MLLTGEAGIGKSHLARKLAEWCNAQGAVVLSTTCPQARTPLPYVALASPLASPQLAERLNHMDDADVASLQVLSPALRRRYAGRHLDPQARQWQDLRLQQALIMLLSDSSEPTLLILDDAQWCDVRRRHLHRRVVEAMIEMAASESSSVFADEGDLIAEHFARAGRAKQATNVYAAFAQSRSVNAAFLRRWT